MNHFEGTFLFSLQMKVHLFLCPFNSLFLLHQSSLQMNVLPCIDANAISLLSFQLLYNSNISFAGVENSATSGDRVVVISSICFISQYVSMKVSGRK